MKKLSVRFLIAALFSALLFNTSSATTIYVGTFADLQTAISGASVGDVISLTNNIVVTEELVVGLSITINGNGYTLTTPVNGVNDNCVLNTSGSDWRIFSFISGSSVLNNMVIKGGYYSGGEYSIEHGGAVYNSATLTMNDCIISNSGAANGGGGICNSGGILYMNNCFVRRNIANYGGGLLNEVFWKKANKTSSGVAYLEKCTFVENRVTTGQAEGGGGAIENRNTAILYMNNSTLSNNQSRAIGGAINNQPSSTVYFINSTATGNVNYGENDLEFGGALGSNSSKYYIVNSLLAYNYRRSAGTESNPTAYVLDDIEPYNYGDGTYIYIYNSIYHSSLPTNGSIAAEMNNIQYTGLQDGSNNTIFTGGLTSKIINDNGVEFGTATIYRPYLYYNQGSVAPVLKAGSFVFSNRGERTRFSSVNPESPVVAFYTGEDWYDLEGQSVTGQEVLLDQVGASRPDPPSRGALEGYVGTLYTFRVLPDITLRGSVMGGSIFGDPYTPGTSVTITAIPNSGYRFKQWNYLSGSGTTSTNNPYTVTVNTDITLQPVYEALSGKYTITYIGNGNTSGTAPASVTQQIYTPTEIPGAGDMVKPGYTFMGWDTTQYGGEASYFEGDQYYGDEVPTLTLYAQWSQEITYTWTGGTSNVWMTDANWEEGSAPPYGSNVVIQTGADNMPVNLSPVTLGSLTMQPGTTLTLGEEMTIDASLILSSGIIYLGNYNLTLGGSATVSGTPSETNMIVTNGTGELRKIFNSAVSFTFPVGDNSGTAEYSPVTLNFTSGSFTSPAYVGIKVENSMFTSNQSVDNYLNRYWSITQSGITSFSCNLTFQYLIADIAGSESSIYCGKYSNNAWTLLDKSDAVNHRLMGFVTQFGDFTGGEEDVLPVNLSYFNSSVSSRNVTLNWQTSSENNNAGFEVQRKSIEHGTVNGEQWKNIGFIDGNGNTSKPAAYTFEDRNLLTGKYKYRLKQMDYNGNFEYYELAGEVEVGVPAKFELSQNYPNPFNPTTKIDFALPVDSRVTLIIYDITGREITRLLNNEFRKASYYTVEFKGSTFSSGVYFYRIQADKNIMTKKMVLIK